MTKARSNATAEAAKGDLRVGNGTNLSGILAVGNNGETLVADSSTSTGLRWQAPVNVNPFLNSNFSVWQRGTSISVSASTTPYTADRWGVYCSPSNALTISRQATGDTTNLPFIQYCMRFQRNAGQTGTGGLNLVQSMETVNSVPYAGKTVTMSFYARAGANYSATSNALTVYLMSGTGTDQNRNGAAYTGEAYPINNQTVTLTTTWQRFTFTGTVGATATELSFYSNFAPTGTAGANDYFEITGIQLEVGSVATPFKTNGATIQGELAACQRYYYRIQGQSSVGMGIGSGYANSTTAFRSTIRVPVTMRTTPSFTSSNVGGSNAFHTIVGSTQVYSDSLSANLLGVDGNGLSQTTSGITTGQGGEIFIDSGKTTSYLEWSSEL